MPGEAEQRRMEADRIATPLQHGTFQIIVEQDTGHTSPCGERRDMAAQKILHAGVEAEAQKYLSRVGQHHDERHQRTARTADLEVTKVGPLCREPDYAEDRGDGRVNWIIWAA
jgi:hypothetical protein